jgi:hypothetical protein
VTFTSKFERANAEMRTAVARHAGDGITPAHTAAAASLAGDNDERDVECNVECEPEAVKAYRDAYEVPLDYPEPIRVSPEDFRRGPIRLGHDAPSPGACA